MKKGYKHKKSLGKQGENIAKEHLQDKGYLVIKCNHRISRYEIDLIAKTGDTLVFVEVKTITGNNYDPLDQIKESQLNNLRLAAEKFSEETTLSYEEIRFDFIGINAQNNCYSLQHIEDAFSSQW